RDLANKASDNGWSSAQFYKHLRATDEYAQAFPGMLNDNGTPKMSEEAYLQTAKAYASTAEQYGINFGDRRQAMLFQNDDSPDEFANRAPAFARIQRDPDLYRQFAVEVSRVTGEKPPNDGQLPKWVLGEKNQEWDQVWRDA